MNQKKAKKLRRLARLIIIQSGRPMGEIPEQQKKMKSVYKKSKGQI